MMFANFRQFLPPDDPMRRAGVYGPAETRAPPTPRTHEEMVADAIESEAFVGAQNNHPRFRTGVFKMCPLALLPFWDMVWDFLPDWMHITKGYFQSHMLPLMKGSRPIAPATILDNPKKDSAITQYVLSITLFCVPTVPCFVATMHFCHSVNCIYTVRNCSLLS
jgi:hypothetical protein